MAFNQKHSYIKLLVLSTVFIFCIFAYGYSTGSLDAIIEESQSIDTNQLLSSLEKYQALAALHKQVAQKAQENHLNKEETSQCFNSLNVLIDKAYKDLSGVQQACLALKNNKVKIAAFIVAVGVGGYFAYPYLNANKDNKPENDKALAEAKAVELKRQADDKRAQEAQLAADAAGKARDKRETEKSLQLARIDSELNSLFTELTNAEGDIAELTKKVSKLKGIVSNTEGVDKDFINTHIEQLKKALTEAIDTAKEKKAKPSFEAIINANTTSLVRNFYIYPDRWKQDKENDLRKPELFKEKILIPIASIADQAKRNEIIHNLVEIARKFSQPEFISEYPEFLRRWLGEKHSEDHWYGGEDYFKRHVDMFLHTSKRVGDAVAEFMNKPETLAKYLNKELITKMLNLIYDFLILDTYYNVGHSEVFLESVLDPIVNASKTPDDNLNAEIQDAYITTITKFIKQYTDVDIKKQYGIQQQNLRERRRHVVWMSDEAVFNKIVTRRRSDLQKGVDSFVELLSDFRM